MPADPEEMEHVPTLPELYAKGLAVVSGWTQTKKPSPTHYTAKPEGQQLIYDTMARNVERFHRNEEKLHAATRAAEARRAGSVPAEGHSGVV